MNPIQKAYDSYDKNNRLLKITNSYYHNRNLGLIHNRKPNFKEPAKSIHARKEDPVKKFYIERDNKDLGEKIKAISEKPTKPQLNDFFINRKEKIHIFKQNEKNYKNQEIDRENERMLKRMKNQKPFIDTKNMDKEFATNHQKLIKKLKKIDNQSVILPKVTSDEVFKNKYKKTEEKKNEEEPDVAYMEKEEVDDKKANQLGGNDKNENNENNENNNDEMYVENDENDEKVKE